MWSCSELRKKIVSELSQTGDIGESRDGMDLSLVKLNVKDLSISWSGANNPIWILPNKKLDEAYDNEKTNYRGLVEIKAQKEPIGHHNFMSPFKNHTLQLSKGDVFYLFSDGYADQFGGEKGKKFKYKSLKDLMIETKTMSMQEAKIKMDEVFNSWKGELEQIDDVCIMGVRL